MADTTPTQALNELRRMLKSYEDLKRAETVLAILAEAEAVGKSLEAQKDKAAKDLDSMKQEIEAAHLALEIAKADLSDTKAKTNVVLSDAKSYADSIVTRANEVASEIKENAKTEAASVHAAIALAKRELMEHDSAALIARNKHEAFVAHAAASKAQIIESLTSLGSH